MGDEFDGRKERKIKEERRKVKGGEGMENGSSRVEIK